MTVSEDSTQSQANLQQQQKQVIETSYLQSNLTGPTFVFRFYCRGENDTNSYRESLKMALNEALLYFLSEYLTHIDCELYLNPIELKRSPATFRRIGFELLPLANKKKYFAGSANPVNTTESSNDQQQNSGEEKCSDDNKSSGGYNRKRHKSTGAEILTDTSKLRLAEKSGKGKTTEFKKYPPAMNKTALNTKLGQLLSNNRILNEEVDVAISFVIV